MEYVHTTYYRTGRTDESSIRRVLLFPSSDFSNLLAIFIYWSENTVFDLTCPNRLSVSSLIGNYMLFLRSWSSQMVEKSWFLCSHVIFMFPVPVLISKWDASFFFFLMELCWSLNYSIFLFALGWILFVTTLYLVPHKLQLWFFSVFSFEL